MSKKEPQNIDWKAESYRFDGVAERYDQHRPDYPDALVEGVIEVAGLHPGDRILEIGCGPGKATRLFAEAGFQLHCIEPGANLLAIAEKHFSDYPVTFECARFEEWEETQTNFDLVMSAQAFHWVPEEIGYAKAARTLRPGGHIALIWNMYPGPKNQIFQDIDAVYRKHAPEVIRPEDDFERGIEKRKQSILDSELFEDLQILRYPWSEVCDVEHYLGLLGTYSDHLRLPEDRRQRLYDGVAEVIESHGGTIEKPYVAVLYIAKVEK
jgi:SAM-dependent methyltransferase